MTDLSSDLAAIRARCEAYANAHAPYSEDDLWELNLTPDAVPFFLHAQSDLPRLLARLEEMQRAMERLKEELPRLLMPSKCGGSLPVCNQIIEVICRPLDALG